MHTISPSQYSQRRSLPFSRAIYSSTVKYSLGSVLIRLASLPRIHCIEAQSNKPKAAAVVPIAAARRIITSHRLDFIDEAHHFVKACKTPINYRSAHYLILIDESGLLKELFGQIV